MSLHVEKIFYIIKPRAKFKVYLSFAVTHKQIISFVIFGTFDINNYAGETVTKDFFELNAVFK